MADDSDYEEEYVYDEDDEEDLGITDNGDYDSTEEDGVKIYVNGGSGDKRRKSSSPTSMIRMGRLPEEGSFRILKLEEVEEFMNGQVKVTNELLSLDEDSAMLLLQHFRWRKERLTNAYMDDPERTMIKAGLSVDPNSEAELGAEAVTGSELCCRVCYDNVKVEDALALDCHHYFCKDCYTGYLSSSVSSGPQCVYTKCAQHKCEMAMHRTKFREMLTEPSTLVKYDKYVMSAFIDTHPALRFCPAPGCDKVAIGNGVTYIECTCGLPFCFRCGEEVHDPASCDQVSEWSTKCSNESETANWILANTKQCPKCSTRIEKNQGCNHMTCKLCKHGFCWICLGDWGSHNSATGGYYKCNRYEATDNKVEKAKAELDRYLHYYQRYHNHSQSQKFAQNTMDATERRMHDMQESGQDWSEVQYLKTAAQEIIRCRRVLKYTYIMGYFLKDETDKQKACKQLFEYHQEMLEKNTEELHGLAEANVNDHDRERVVNCTRVTEKLLFRLMECMMEGERDLVLTRQHSDGTSIEEKA